LIQLENEPMPVQIQLTLKDYLRAYRLHMRWSYFFFPVVGSCLILGGICQLWIGMGAANGVAAMALGALFVAAFPILLRRQFRCNKKLILPFQVTPTSEGIEMTAEYGNSLTRWNAFVKSAENKDFFLLYPQPALFLVFPKRFFSSEQLEEFGRLMRANVEPKTGQGRMVIKLIVVWTLILIGIIVLYQVIKSPGQ
jgi:hypothetical protein